MVQACACVQVHGRDWKRLGQAVPNKTETQIKNYFQNYKTKVPCSIYMLFQPCFCKAWTCHSCRDMQHTVFSRFCVLPSLVRLWSIATQVQGGG